MTAPATNPIEPPQPHQGAPGRSAWALVLAGLVPVALFAALVIVQFSNVQRQNVEDGLQGVTRALAIAVGQELSARLRDLEILATSRALADGDLASFHAQMTQVVALGGQQWIGMGIIDSSDGRIVATSLRPFGDPLPSTSAPEGVWRIAVTGRPEVLGVVPGSITPAPLILAGTPIRAGGSVRYVLVGTFSPSVLNDILAGQRLSAGSAAAVIDSSLRVAGRSRAADSYVGKTVTPSMIEPLKTQASGVVAATSLEGWNMLAAFQRIPGHDWSLVLGVPVESVEAPLRRQFMGFIGGGLAFVMIGLGLGFMLIRDDARRQRAKAARQAALIGIARAEERSAAAERTAQVSEAWARAILDVALDGIIAISKRGTIEHVNPAAERIFGWRGDEMIGQNIRLLMPEPDRSRHDGYLAHYRETGEAKIIGIGREVTGRRKDGSTFPLDLGVSEVRLDGRRAYVGVLRDITDQRRVGSDLTRAKEQAEAANRAKSELLANMSHELRTPLNAIIGFSEFILSDEDDRIEPAKVREYLGDIHGSAEHLLGLISDVLDMAAVEAGELPLRLEPFDAKAALASAVKLVRNRADKGNVRLVEEVPANLPKWVADPRRFKQIIINLLSNAVKYTSAEGEVRLSAAVDGAGHFNVTVADTGIGMNEADIAKALTPFGQVESGYVKSREGTGLGLPLTVRLVEMHKGSMRIDSRPGAGTTVTVSLPPYLGA